MYARPMHQIQVSFACLLVHLLCILDHFEACYQHLPCIDGAVCRNEHLVQHGNRLLVCECAHTTCAQMSLLLDPRKQACYCLDRQPICQPQCRMADEVCTHSDVLWPLAAEPCTLCSVLRYKVFDSPYLSCSILLYPYLCIQVWLLRCYVCVASYGFRLCWNGKSVVFPVGCQL